MSWVREGVAFRRGGAGEPDAVRAWRPWVLEQPDGELHMWYSGHDGTAWRILRARRRGTGAWERLGAVIDPGLAGDTDDFGVQAPSVVPTPGGYLMAYAGFDGEVARLHMAASPDGGTWEPLGTFLQRGIEDRAGAADPCLLTTGERWWLFYSSVEGATGGGTRILGAVSDTGASWDRLGPVLEPDGDEIAVGVPCVVEHERTLHMFFASAEAGRVSVALATSDDGVRWERRGPVLNPSGQGPDGAEAHAPCVVRLRDGTVRMWYSGLAAGDTELGYSVCEARFDGPWAT